MPVPFRIGVVRELQPEPFVEADGPLDIGHETVVAAVVDFAGASDE